MLTDAEIGALVSDIVALLNPHRVVLFGSYAKGRATATSDLDILVILDTALPQGSRAALMAPVIAGYSVPIDAHVYAPREAEVLGAVEHTFMHSIQRTGRVVYDAGGATP